MSANLADSQWDRFHPFLSSVAEIRSRARQQIQAGAASADRAIDRDAVLRLLNAALATELACVVRYRRYCLMTADAVPDARKNEFMKRAQEEQGHADQIAAHIVELGGQPNLNSSSAPDRREIELADDEMLTDMLAEDLIAERIAIDTYRDIVRYLGEREPATRQLIENIMSAEQGHAEELASLRDEMLRRERAAATAAAGAASQAGAVLEEMR
jgi:bacterioferritin